MLRTPGVVAGIARLLPLALPTRAEPRLRHRACRANGRLFTYGEVSGWTGEEDVLAPTVLLVHGWGLAHSSYKRAAEALATHGFRVLVPDMPGFGWTGDLPIAEMSFARLADALRDFLTAVVPIDPETGRTQKVHVVGHSMGGAVGTQLAHDTPDLVATLVMVAAASGATWSRDDLAEKLMTERPIWDWALHLLSEFPMKEFPVAAVPVFRDLGHNLIWHLPSMGLAAHITRRSDLRAELAKVVRHGIPIKVVRAAGDGVVTQACYDDQCRAVGYDGTIVKGNHGWPLTDPDDFGDVIAGLLEAPPT